MKYLKDSFELCKRYVLNSVISYEDLIGIGYTEDEISLLEKKRVLAKKDTGFIIANINLLAYYMERLYQNGDNNLGDKFSEKITSINPEFKTSYLNMFYIATLYGDYEVAYFYYKKMPRNLYTNLYQFLFSFIIDLPIEDVREVKSLELNDFLIGDLEIENNINYSIYFSKFVRAINLINEKYRNDNFMSKYDAILKTLCSEANQKKKNAEHNYVSYLENERISDCKSAILNENKKRSLNKNEKLLLELIDDYELISNGYIPQLLQLETNNIVSAIRSNDFFLALCMSKSDNRSSLNILLEKISRLIIANAHLDNFDEKDFQAKIENAINLVRDDNEVILMDEMNDVERIIFFKVILDNDDLTVSRVGNANSYRYILMNNKFQEDIDKYHFYINEATNQFKSNQYEEALNNYKLAMFSLGKTTFECFTKIGKCYLKLEKKELAYNYFMINYYNALNSVTREKTHRFLANIIYSMSYDIKDDYRFYQILANLNIFDNISIEELKKQYYLKIDDEQILMAFIALKLKEIGLIEQAQVIIKELKSKNITSLKAKRYIDYLNIDESYVKTKKK